jgi:predicted nucleic acid-binding protein
MRYVLDTNVASETLNPRADPHCVAWLAKQASETLFLTAASVAELHYGVALARRRGKANVAALQSRVAAIEASAGILPLDFEAGIILGELWASPALLDHHQGA